MGRGGRAGPHQPHQPGRRALAAQAPRRLPPLRGRPWLQPEPGAGRALRCGRRELDAREHDRGGQYFLHCPLCMDMPACTMEVDVRAPRAGPRLALCALPPLSLFPAINGWCYPRRLGTQAGWKGGGHGGFWAWRASCRPSCRPAARMRHAGAGRRRPRPPPAAHGRVLHQRRQAVGTLDRDPRRLGVCGPAGAPVRPDKVVEYAQPAQQGRVDLPEPPCRPCAGPDPVVEPLRQVVAAAVNAAAVDVPYVVRGRLQKVLAAVRSCAICG